MHWSIRKIMWLIRFSVLTLFRCILFPHNTIPKSLACSRCSVSETKRDRARFGSGCVFYPTRFKPPSFFHSSATIVPFVISLRLTNWTPRPSRLLKLASSFRLNFNKFNTFCVICRLAFLFLISASLQKCVIILIYATASSTENGTLAFTLKRNGGCLIKNSWKVVIHIHFFFLIDTNCLLCGAFWVAECIVCVYPFSYQSDNGCNFLCLEVLTLVQLHFSFKQSTSKM